MKKLFIVIIILLIVFIGMFIYKHNVNSNNVTINEVNKIEEYMSKIYMWREVTGDPLPKFDNINDANENWLWRVVKRDLEDYELSYDQIQNRAKQIFGENFTKEFPKDGTDYLIYDNETDKYYSQRDIINNKLDKFYLSKIEKDKTGYKVEIIEYVENHVNLEEAEANSDLDDTSQLNYDVYIENLNGETIGIIKSTNGETAGRQVVKEHTDRFNKKEIFLVKDKDLNVHVESVKD